MIASVILKTNFSPRIPRDLNSGGMLFYSTSSFQWLPNFSAIESFSIKYPARCPTRHCVLKILPSGDNKQVVLAYNSKGQLYVLKIFHRNGGTCVRPPMAETGDEDEELEKKEDDEVDETRQTVVDVDCVTEEQEEYADDGDDVDAADGDDDDDAADPWEEVEEGDCCTHGEVATGPATYVPIRK